MPLLLGLSCCVCLRFWYCADARHLIIPPQHAAATPMSIVFIAPTCSPLRQDVRRAVRVVVLWRAVAGCVVVVLREVSTRYERSGAVLGAGHGVDAAARVFVASLRLILSAVLFFFAAGARVSRGAVSLRRRCVVDSASAMARAVAWSAWCHAVSVHACVRYVGVLCVRRVCALP